ncbi:MAG: hypothetical protein LBE11_03660 [Prevotellaceae bacterium]|jgi:hypothetical protein|nr:hypothetical protein [Prevotellaceae bacterium]
MKILLYHILCAINKDIAIQILSNILIRLPYLHLFYEKIRLHKVILAFAVLQSLCLPLPHKIKYEIQITDYRQ